MVKDGLLVIALKAATVQRVIDVEAEQSTLVREPGHLQGPCQCRWGVEVIGASEGLQDLGEIDQKARVLRHVETASMQIIEAGDQ